MLFSTLALVLAVKHEGIDQTTTRAAAPATSIPPTPTWETDLAQSATVSGFGIGATGSRRQDTAILLSPQNSMSVDPATSIPPIPPTRGMELGREAWSLLHGATGSRRQDTAIDLSPRNSMLRTAGLRSTGLRRSASTGMLSRANFPNLHTYSAEARHSGLSLGAVQQAVLQRDLDAMTSKVETLKQQLEKQTALLDYLGLAEPAVAKAEFITGHMPAFEVYKTPDPRVRVVGANTPLANSLEITTLGTNKFEPNHEVRATMVYSQGYLPTGVEMQLPTFVLPHDERTLEVLHQGEVVYHCEVPTLDGPCLFEFTEEHAGQEFTVKATQTSTRRVLQQEHVYVPLPFMCAASMYSRTDIDRMDCSPMPEEVPRSAVLSVTTPRGFAVEIEFMARDTSVTGGVFGPDALEEVKQCMTAKLAGTPFGQGVWKKWNWEEEPSMVPFGPRETSDVNEYSGLMAELTTPGPPNVLLGQQGLTDVVTVFDNLRHMGVQIGLWAQLHVHVNVLSTAANGECCLSTDQIANLWASWAHFQLVIDEMQSSTNVNNKWAMPLDLRDPIVKEVFANMHAQHGTGLPAQEACEAFYGAGMCDGKGSSHGAYRPVGLPESSVGYPHSPARYYALNLAPLTGKGTIEVRQQAGTHDPERAQRWVQFVLAFFETFKDAGAVFFDGTLAEDVLDLRAAQESASFEELFGLLGDRVDTGSQQYYQERHWAKEAPGHSVLKPGCSFESK